MRIATVAPVPHPDLLGWVGRVVVLTQPDAVAWFDGSAEQLQSFHGLPRTLSQPTDALARRLA